MASKVPIEKNPFFTKFKLRDTQQEVVAYVGRRMRETGKGVTLTDIAYNFGWTNRVTPLEYVRRLIVRGYLQKTRQWGSIILAPKPPIDCPPGLLVEWMKTDLESFYGNGRERATL